MQSTRHNLLAVAAENTSFYYGNIEYTREVFCSGYEHEDRKLVDAVTERGRDTGARKKENEIATSVRIYSKTSYIN